MDWFKTDDERKISLQRRINELTVLDSELNSIKISTNPQPKLYEGQGPGTIFFKVQSINHCKANTRKELKDEKKLLEEMKK